MAKRFEKRSNPRPVSLAERKMVEMIAKTRLANRKAFSENAVRLIQRAREKKKPNFPAKQWLGEAAKRTIRTENPALTSLQKEQWGKRNIAQLMQMLKRRRLT